jgi:endonuclease/exonuclease/phosphatase (EEP) superfamily protein YafD
MHSRLAGITTLQADIIQRGDEAALVSQFARETGRPVLMAGDFNMPVESCIYQKCWGDFSNAFSATGWGWGFSKYTRWHGVRIDQIAGDQQWQFSECYVAGNIGSDHLPVVARAALSPSPQDSGLMPVQLGSLQPAPKLPAPKIEQQ